MTALERAARAAHDVDQTPCGSSVPMPESWRLNEFRYVNIVRAVLMAVIPTLKRYDSDQAGPYEDERGDYVLFADLDAILNEKDTTND